jgi:hypothetical protein
MTSKTWTIDEVKNWLKGLSISEEVIKTFSDNGIDGKALLSLKPEEIKDDLGVKQLGPR